MLICGNDRCGRCQLKFIIDFTVLIAFRTAFFTPSKTLVNLLLIASRMELTVLFAAFIPVEIADLTPLIAVETAVLIAFHTFVTVVLIPLTIVVTPVLMPFQAAIAPDLRALMAVVTPVLIPFQIAITPLRNSSEVFHKIVMAVTIPVIARMTPPIGEKINPMAEMIPDIRPIIGVAAAISPITVTMIVLVTSSRLLNHDVRFDIAVAACSIIGASTSISDIPSSMPLFLS